MKAVFGVVSLLVVLAVVGLLASRQMKAVPVVAPAASASNGVSAVPPARELPAQVQQEVNKALEQAASRNRDIDQ